MISPIVDALFSIDRFKELIDEIPQGKSSVISDEDVDRLREMLEADEKTYESLLRIYDWSDEDIGELRTCIEGEKSRCENFGLEHLIPTVDQLHERVLGLAGN